MSRLWESGHPSPHRWSHFLWTSSERQCLSQLRLLWGEHTGFLLTPGRVRRGFDCRWNVQSHHAREISLYKQDLNWLL
jgi:hypothetical protein